ncbi:uncharacterized protein C8A04DRAFT_38157 [Dichotomopilus funicola]|uniref:Anaphase-promoting complex subunit 2 n=1 Tax=Dichotomopilus funicola TaxID=1934379 RepID=A0AAN6ZM36_9PEZI|nr:hypothetical protein C8A04DRAFT_38157 [Dichotomopilus funicola]
MPVAVSSQWRGRQRRVFESVFQTDPARSTPQTTPGGVLSGPGHPFRGPAASLSGQQYHSESYGQYHQHAPEEQTLHTQTPAQPPFHPITDVGGDHQAAYNRAWQIVTARIALPSSATANESFGVSSEGGGTGVSDHITSSSSKRRARPHRGGETGIGMEPGPLPPHRALAWGGSVSDADFHSAFALLASAGSMLPQATRTGDVVAWHALQTRRHFAQHVIPLLKGCFDEAAAVGSGEGGEEDEDDDPDGGRPSREEKRKGKAKRDPYERHLVVVVSSIRTLEAALRLYFHGLNQLLSGFARLAEAVPDAAKDAELLNSRFRKDLHALVSASAFEGLVPSLRAVLARLAGTILGALVHDGTEAQPARPAPPGPDDIKAQAARGQLLELVQQLHNVGLTGEQFQALFAEAMGTLMSDFVDGAYGGLWSASDPRSFSAAMDSVSRNVSLPTLSPCLVALNDWVENHFARLTSEVLSCASENPMGPGPLPVTLADLKMYQSLAQGRLAVLRIQELFDIVLAWPASRPALDDLKATLTTAARRKQLTDSFSRALRTRLLHPGCSTLQILQTYISIIRTLHALDPSKVLLSRVESDLRLYLCQREDAVRVVVAGLLASHEEMRAARKAKDAWKRQRGQQSKRGEGGQVKHQRRDVDPFTTPGPSNRTSRAERTPVVTPGTEATPSHITSTPTGTPTGAGTPSSKPPRYAAPAKLVELALLLNNDPSTQSRRAAAMASEDGDLDWQDLSWLPDPIDAGANYKRPKRSEDVIGTLISALGSEDVFIKEFSTVMADRLLAGGTTEQFDQELRVLNLLKRRFGEASLQACDVMVMDVIYSRKMDEFITREEEGMKELVGRDTGGMEYHARILSRLFWPGLDREHFLLPQEVLDQQTRYEAGYEALKSRRTLTWLNHMGKARVEIELKDRTVTVDCTTLEATVVHAFQGGDESDEPMRKDLDDLYAQLQMDEDLIQAALQFWVGKGVLRRVGGAHGNVYVVAETLHEPTSSTTDQPAGDDDGDGNRPMDAETADESAAGTTKQGDGLSAKERERREMYWRYIQGMLTNASASMPLFQVAMMMKMLIPEGFPWSNDELQEFLGEKVAGGEMEIVGGKYRLKK